MKVLVDTSVWIAHLRAPVAELITLLSERRVLTHAIVLGELACGQFKRRNEILGNLKILPRATPAEFEEGLELIETEKLYGRGLGFSDIQILASAILSEARLFTYDKALKAAAERCAIKVISY